MISQIPCRISSFITHCFSPWLGYNNFNEYYSLAHPYTLVSPDRCYILLSLASQAANFPGAWIECGFYKGGTAVILTKLMRDCGCSSHLYLFDTFQGMPETDQSLDIHRKGDFIDTDLESVKKRIQSVSEENSNRVLFYPGFIPDTFAGCEIEHIAFAHVDVDIFQSVLDCCDFIYPRLLSGGVLVFDNYGFPSCPGARTAVDRFFADKPEIPIVLPTGQAIVIKI